MKKIVALSVIALMIASCSPEGQYVVKGKIKGSDGITFYLRIRHDGAFANIDSAVSKRGSFVLKNGDIEYPQTVVLVAGNTNKMTSFYLENSTDRKSSRLNSSP